MEITKEMLIANETILAARVSDKDECLYLGNVPNCNVYFTSQFNNYNMIGETLTLERINKKYKIKQPESKVVPLEKKVYDFVPVRVRDTKDVDWMKAELIACIPYETDFPYRVLINSNELYSLRYCEFI